MVATSSSDPMAVTMLEALSAWIYDNELPFQYFSVCLAIHCLHICSLVITWFAIGLMFISISVLAI